MKISFDWAKRRHLLVLILILVFGASSVLIVFERSQKQEAFQLSSKSAKESLQAVQGQSVISDKEIAAYRQFASQTFESVQAIIKDVASDNELNLGNLRSLEAGLLSARVPLPYRELHFDLLKMVRNLGVSVGPDLDFLEEQSRLLSEKYLWL